MITIATKKIGYSFDQIEGYEISITFNSIKIYGMVHIASQFTHTGTGTLNKEILMDGQYKQYIMGRYL